MTTIASLNRPIQSKRFASPAPAVKVARKVAAADGFEVSRKRAAPRVDQFEAAKKPSSVLKNAALVAIGVGIGAVIASLFLGAVKSLLHKVSDFFSRLFGKHEPAVVPPPATIPEPAVVVPEPPVVVAPAPPAKPAEVDYTGLAGDRVALDKAIRDAIKPTDVASAFEVTKRIAWALRGEGAGLLVKNGGENIVSWQGKSFSAGRICFPDGTIFKVLSDVGPGGANGASWQDNGRVDPSLYVAAIDPSLA